MRRLRWLGVLAFCAAVLVACGDHKKAVTTTPPATTTTAPATTATAAPAPAETVAPAIEPVSSVAAALRPTVPLSDLDQIGGALGAPPPEVEPGGDQSEADSVGLQARAQGDLKTQDDGALDAGLSLREAPGRLQRFTGTRGLDEPPDAVGAIGPKQFVLATNSTLAILDRDGKKLVSHSVDDFWASAGGRCATNPRGDPALIYDEAGERFVLAQFAFDGNPRETEAVETFQCLAISDTSDATGGWSVTSFRWGARFHDYPKIGVAPGAYAITAYSSLPSGKRLTRMALVERNALLALREPRVQQFDVGPGWLPLIPGDLDDAAPTAGGPAVFAGISDDNWGSGGTSTKDEVVVVQVPVDFDAAAPAPRVFRLPTLAFDSTICDGDLACIEQPGTTQKIDALGNYTMSRVPIRVGTGQSARMVVAADVQAGAENRSGVRWFEIGDPFGTPSIAQQGTWAPDDGVSRFIGSPAIDAAGNLAIAYDVAGTTVKPGVRYAARAPGDPAGTLPIAEGTLLEGEGVEKRASRWGDYATLSVDPVDRCTFWLAGQFAPAIPATAVDVVTFRLPGCTPGG